jgi:putative oxidoreductase
VERLKHGNKRLPCAMNLKFAVVALEVQVLGKCLENSMQPSDLARWAVLPLRLMVGYGFIEHGFAKLSLGPDAFASILQQLGVPLPHLATWVTIVTELLGGLALLVGAFVAWASVPTAVILLVAMVTVHLLYGFSSVQLQSASASGVQFGPVGYELDLLYLAALIVLALQGPGPLSIDNVLQRRLRH